MTKDAGEKNETPKNIIPQSLAGIAIDFHLAPNGRIYGYHFPLGVASPWRPVGNAAADAYRAGWNDALESQAKKAADEAAG